jgi:hypothetical protein
MTVVGSGWWVVARESRPTLPVYPSLAISACSARPR